MANGDITAEEFMNGDPVDPLASAVAGTPSPASYPSSDSTPAAGRTFSIEDALKRQGGLGLSEETLRWLGNNPDQIRVGNLPAGAADSVFRLLQLMQAGSEVGASYLDEAARKTGLSDALSLPGGGTEFLPGSAVMAAAEAFPLGGLELGGLKPGMGKRIDPQLEAELVADRARFPDLTDDQYIELVNKVPDNDTGLSATVTDDRPKSEPSFVVPENDNPMGSMSAQVPEKVVPGTVAPEVIPQAANEVAGEAPDLSRVRTPEDLDNEINGPGDGSTNLDDLPARQRRAELAERLGYTPEEFEKVGGNALNSVQAERGVQLVDQSNARITELLDKAEAGELAEADLTDLVGEISKFRAINNKLTGTISEGARILDVAAARDKGPKSLSKLLDGTSIKTPEDARVLAERLRAANNSPEARRKILNAVTDPRAEDYALSLWYNALLSHPATHITNMIGNATHLGLEGFNKGLASVIGQVGRKADRVYGREIAGNAYGILKAFTSLNTYRNVGKAFLDRGADGGKGAKAVLPGPLTALETPSRSLNAADEFWSQLSKMSSVYGQASKIAAREGKGFGPEFYKRVDELISNTTTDAKLSKRDKALREQMLDRAAKTSDFLTFRDEPSRLSKGIENIRARKQNDTIGTRVLKTGSRLFVPFVQTPDRLTAATVRNSPLAAVRPSTLVKIYKGGEEGNRTLARLTTGSALATYLVYLADQGLLTGSPNENFAKAQEEASGDHQPFSVKLPDGSFMSIKGIDPFSTQAVVVADLVRKYKSGKITDEGYANGIRQVIAAVGTGLSDNTYTGNIADFMQMFEPGYKGEQATNNAAANIASSLTTPAIVRGVNQQLDPVMKDTTGDGSIGDRMVGRVQSGWPGLSDSLPDRHDVYGRPIQRPETVGGMATRLAVKATDEDPTVQELQRLSDVVGNDKVLVGPVKRSDLKEFKASAEDVQKYQQLSGQYILESVRALQFGNEWEKMSDREKLKEVQGIVKDMREAAREQLFPQYYGPESFKKEASPAPKVSEASPERAPSTKPTTFENSVAVGILQDLGLTTTDDGIRSHDTQEKLYRQYKGVAKPGTSPHEFANAVDVKIPKGITPDTIRSAMIDAGYRGVKIITRRHGSGPHWHVQWESVGE